MGFFTDDELKYFYQIFDIGPIWYPQRGEYDGTTAFLYEVKYHPKNVLGVDQKLCNEILIQVNQHIYEIKKLKKQIKKLKKEVAE
jgi:hypothetical protein